MIDKVLEIIRKNDMFQKGDTVIVGLSGGADSVCLLHILSKLRELLEINLIGIHVHHGLRGKSADRDAIFAQEFCKEINVDFELFKKDVQEMAKVDGLSIEEAGRKIRYEIFEAVASQHEPSKIVVAHHMNDQAETLLLNLMRGTGLKGLGGIKAIRGRILRPLLFCTRDEIIGYLNEGRLQWVEDESNDSRQYARNKIRMDMIPFIEKNFNPNFIRQISDMSGLLALDEDYLSQTAQGYFEKNIRICKDRIIGECTSLSQLHGAIRSRVYRMIFLKVIGHVKNYEDKHLKLIDDLIFGSTGKKVNLPQGLIVERVYEEIHFLLNHQKKEEWEVMIDDAVPLIKVQEAEGEFSFLAFDYTQCMKFPQKRYTKWFDYDRILDKLAIRNRRNGDFMRFKGINGKKKLKDYFIDEKVPGFIRDQVPLIALGSEILWVVGYRMNEAYQVTNQTKKILEITYTKEEI